MLLQLNKDLLRKSWIGMLWDCCMVYVDDIVIFSQTEEEHIEKIKQLLQRLRDAGLMVNTKKCSFAQPEFEILGHICSGDGVSPNPKKVFAILDYPMPEDRPALHRFLGLVTWVAKFIQNTSSKMINLWKLLHGKEPFKMEEDHIEEFESIKKALAEPLMLAYPEFEKPFHVHVDASKNGLGAILTQLDENERHRVIAFASAPLKVAQKKMTASVLECIGVVWAVTYFRQYVHGRSFYVYTDHLALVTTFKTPSTSQTLDKLATHLLGYDMHIMHAPGSKMTGPDALSRANYMKYEGDPPEYCGKIDDLPLQFLGQGTDVNERVGNLRGKLNHTVNSIVENQPITGYDLVVRTSSDGSCTEWIFEPVSEKKSGMMVNAISAKKPRRKKSIQSEELRDKPLEETPCSPELVGSSKPVYSSKKDDIRKLGERSLCIQDLRVKVGPRERKIQDLGVQRPTTNQESSGQSYSELQIIEDSSSTELGIMNGSLTGDPLFDLMKENEMNQGSDGNPALGDGDCISVNPVSVLQAHKESNVDEDLREVEMDAQVDWKCSGK